MNSPITQEKMIQIATELGQELAGNLRNVYLDDFGKMSSSDRGLLEDYPKFLDEFVPSQEGFWLYSAKRHLARSFSIIPE